ncbi:MAG: ABC transporter substrate-binding protein [Reyranellales bacterium]
MKTLWLGVVLCVVALAPPASAQSAVSVECSVPAAWCALVADEFRKATGVDVSIGRKEAGEVLAQLRSEAEKPTVDVWFGGAGDAHLKAAGQGLTEVYASPLLSELHPWALKQNANSGGRSVGLYADVLGFVFNTEFLIKNGVTAPACWADLLKPEFKGEIRMDDPDSSGAAYLAIATLVQLMGEDKAFGYLGKLHANLKARTRFDIAPIKAVARSEAAVSVGFVADSVIEVLAGFPVKTATPCDGTGYELGAMSIVKDARNAANARKFYDWALSPEAQKLAARARQFEVPSNRATPVQHQAPTVADTKLIDYDQSRYGEPAERKRLIARWDAGRGPSR